MSFTRFIWSAALLFAVAWVNSAFGAIELLQNGVNKLEDDDYEQAYITSNQDGQLLGGDILFGVYEIQVINGTNATTSTFSGAFAAKVSEVYHTAGSDTATYYFAPVSDGEWSLLFPTLAARESSNTMIQVYDNPNGFSVVDPIGAINDAVDDVSTGLLAFELGIDPAKAYDTSGTHVPTDDAANFLNNDFDVWKATVTSSVDPLSVLDIEALRFLAALSVTFQDPTVNIQFLGITPVQSGQVTGGGSWLLPISDVHLVGTLETYAADEVGDFALKTDSDFWTNVNVVPEPASMLVWSGLSIVGFGLAAARKRRLAAKTA